MKGRFLRLHYFFNVASVQAMMDLPQLPGILQIFFPHQFHHHNYYCCNNTAPPTQAAKSPASACVPAGKQQGEVGELIVLFFNIINTLSTPRKNLVSMDILYTYMVKGIIDSGIVEDGGPQCYAEIPKAYHIMSATASVLAHLLMMRSWGSHLAPALQQPVPQKPSRMEKAVAGLGIVSLLLTLYFKLMTGKGMFIFNPCHTALLLVVVLLLSPTSEFSRKLHTCWTAWLYGAILALTVPHLYGITQFQVYLYYFQHLLIVPVGPLLLYRRYKFAKPTFRNQMASFGSMVIYQLGFLLPLCLLTQVNLNFSLCHSPADPFFQYAGYHYFTGAVVVLNVFSFMGRWATYLLVVPIKVYELNCKGEKRRGEEDGEEKQAMTSEKPVTP